jgi:hypothetical protein
MIAQPQYAFAPTMMAEGGLVPAAKAVQNQGRGRDTMLVHMTPKEVGGLQALAMQHGGSLSINPQTGLPEAGFLENILPTLLGVGLSFIPGVGPMMAAGLVGGGTAIATGDLSKGLMAGLGAFGGANLAAGLGAAGASSAAPGAAGSAGLEFANAASPEFLASQGAGAAGVPSSLGTTVNPVTFGDTGAAIYGGAPSAAMTAPRDVFGNVLGVDEMASLTGNSGRVLTAGQAPATFASNAAQAGQGFQNLITGQPGSFDNFIGTAATKTAPATGLGGTMGAVKTAGSVAAPLLTPEPYKPPKGEKSTYEGPYTPTPRTVRYPTEEERRRTSEFMYFTPSNPVPFADGGKVEERGAVRMPGSDYVAGRMPEFNHGFRAVKVESAPTAGLSTPVGNVARAISKIINRNAPNYTDLSEYEYVPDTQTMRRVASLSTPMRMKDGGVPMLEDGGFVLTKKAVDGLGKGSNKKGQENARRGLGAIPIKGAGAKRGPKAGVDDKIKTTIEGKRPALVSNGEAYVPKKQVAKRGGAKAFYALMKKAERRA